MGNSENKLNIFNTDGKDIAEVEKNNLRLIKEDLESFNESDEGLGESLESYSEEFFSWLDNEVDNVGEGWSLNKYQGRVVRSNWVYLKEKITRKKV